MYNFLYYLVLEPYEYIFSNYVYYICNYINTKQKNLVTVTNILQIWIVLFSILIIKYKLSKLNLECNHHYILVYVVIIFPLVLGQLKPIRNFKPKIWIIPHY